MSSQKKTKIARSRIFWASRTRRPLVPGEAVCARPIVGKEGAVEVFAEAAIFLIEAVLKLALLEPLALDQRQQFGPPAGAPHDELVSVEQAREQETVEPPRLVSVQKRSVLEQFLLFDGKADELPFAAIRPVKPELVHVGDYGPGRNDRFISEHALPCCVEIIEALFYRRARITLAFFAAHQGHF